MRGATVCRTHGGSAPQVRRAAERRIEKARIADEVRRLFSVELDDLEGVDVEPADIFVEQMRVSVIWERTLRLMIADLVPGVTRVDDVSPEKGETGDLPAGVMLMERHETFSDESVSVKLRVEVNALVELWRDARADLTRQAKAMLDLGLDERRVRIAEREADVLVAVCRRLLRGVGWDPSEPESVELVRESIAGVLAEVG